MVKLTLVFEYCSTIIIFVVYEINMITQGFYDQFDFIM